MHLLLALVLLLLGFILAFFSFRRSSGHQSSQVSHGSSSVAYCSVTILGFRRVSFFPNG